MLDDDPQRTGNESADTALIGGSDPEAQSPSLSTPRPGIAITTRSPRDPSHMRTPAPWAPQGPNQPWAPAGLELTQAQPDARTHLRLYLAIGAAVLLTGSLVTAAIVVSRGGSGSGQPGIAATAQARSTGTSGATGATGAQPTAAATAAAGATSSTASASPAIATATGPVTAATSLAATEGSAVYTADFSGKGGGWPAVAKDGLTTFAFTAHGYAITGLGGALHYLVYSPQTSGSQQLSVAITATLSSESTGAGFGVSCRRGQGGALVSYEMLVLDDGRWYVERRDGPPSLGVEARILSKGSSAVLPGPLPITLVGMCATLNDGTSTRLALFVEGKQLADVTDSSTLPADGWLSGILAAGGDEPMTVIVSSFVARDLSK
jgi:hypothetical protein